MFRHRAYNTIIEADVPLPFSKVNGSAEAELRICRLPGPMDETGEVVFEQATPDGKHLQTLRRKNRVYVWKYQDSACFAIARDGSRLGWWAADHCTPDVAALLSGPPLGFALQLLGKGGLHGNGLGHLGLAFGLLGRSGSGKSTLSAALLQAGCRFLTDDVLVVDWQSGRPFVHPGQARLKLWPESLAHFLPEESWRPLKPYVSWLEKRVLTPDRLGEACESPLPLSALYLLEPAAPESEVRIGRLRGQQALLSLVAHSYQAVLMNLESRILADQLSQFQALAASVPVFVLHYPRDLKRLAEVAQSLLRHVAAEGDQGTCES
jgi:hypothetical protein